MAKYIGVASVSPDRMVTFLEKRGTIASCAEIAVIPDGVILSPEKKPMRNVFFILSISVFYRNIDTFNQAKYDNCQIFIFSSPLKLHELDGVVGIDFVPSLVSTGFGFSVLDHIDTKQYRIACKSSRQCVRRKIPYIQNLVASTKDGSLLTPLMTLIYSMPASNQSIVKKAAIEYLINGNGSTLEATILGMSPQPSAKFLSALQTLLKSEIAKQYSIALKSVRKHKPRDVKEFCKEFKVSEYEINYLTSILHGAKHG